METENTDGWGGEKGKDWSAAAVNETVCEVTDALLQHSASDANAADGAQ